MIVRLPPFLPASSRVSLRSRPSLRARFTPRSPLLSHLGLFPLALTLLSALPHAVSAETLLQTAVRKGELVMVGAIDSPPMLSLDAKGQPVGFVADLARRIEAELQSRVRSKVSLRFIPVKTYDRAVQAVSRGEAALACGIGFSWHREDEVDYSLPIGTSGLRVLVLGTAIDGTPSSLAGRRLAVLEGSLAARDLPLLQPAAKPVTVPSIEAGLQALSKGQVEGVIGDSNLLAGMAAIQGVKGRLVPEEPYSTYAVACVLPENNSDFANVVNITIARLMQGYLEGNPEAVAMVNRWYGPGSILDIPADRIRIYFQTVLSTRESITP